MKGLDDLKLAGKRVLVRVDFNVPLDGKGGVADDMRIGAVLPSIRKVLEDGGRLILASHLGRPKGKVVPEMSLAPVARRLEEILGRSVPLAPDCVGQEVEKLAGGLRNGEVLLLENLRFHQEETKDDDEFARKLARLADAYVNDAFAACHRAHASVHGITRHVAECAAGYQLQKELHYFAKALEEPARPLAVIVGGAKVSTKIGLLENLVARVDRLFIGGAMANTFLKARGLSVGRSLVEDDYVETARALLEKASKAGVAVHLPEDVTAAPELEQGASARTFAASEVPSDMKIFDVGPRTLKAFQEALGDCPTIVWNGPVGVFETEAFGKGTFDLAEFLAGTGALTVIGGGDTAAAVRRAGVADKVGYVSTGGGAFLELMEGKTLPGVAALEECGKGEKRA